MAGKLEHSIGQQSGILVLTRFGEGELTLWVDVDGNYEVARDFGYGHKTIIAKGAAPTPEEARRLAVTPVA